MFHHTRVPLACPVNNGFTVVKNLAVLIAGRVTIGWRSTLPIGFGTAANLVFVRFAADWRVKLARDLCNGLAGA